MWNVELNIAGFRFTSESPQQRRRYFRLSSRLTHWPLAQHRHSPAA